MKGLYAEEYRLSCPTRGVALSSNCWEEAMQLLRLVLCQVCITGPNLPLQSIALGHILELWLTCIKQKLIHQEAARVLSRQVLRGKCQAFEVKTP